MGLFGRKINSRKDNKELGDEELLLAFCDTEDAQYFQILYQRYIPFIYGLALKYLKQPADAQDAVIDIYEDIYKKVAKYEIKNFNNWLYSVVKFHCFQKLKENKKEIIVDFDSQIMESEDIINLFDEGQDEQKEAALQDCLKQLPEPQRIAIIKFFYEDKSYTDIVDDTEFHLKSVKSYIQNGKRNLKICIEKKLKQ